MHKQNPICILIISLISAILFAGWSSALPSDNIVISQIQVADEISSSNEFVEIFNNSDNDTEITNWCFYYASALSVVNGSKMACFVTDNENTHLFLPARSYAIAVSNQLADGVPKFNSDAQFSSTLSNSAGHIRIVDDKNNVVDKVAWGESAVSAESNPAPVPAKGKVLQRKMSAIDHYIDTDNNYDDFEIILPRLIYSFGSIYESQDLCSNIDGIQDVIPEGNIVDEEKGCIAQPVDVCLNIDGIQESLAPDYELDEKGRCIIIDQCLNLEGVQLEIPYGYRFDEDNSCKYIILPIIINELLPNPIGSDDGNEYIEIYNPNADEVSLSNYLFYVGADNVKSYSFPDEISIAPNQYMRFSDKDINFTLINTASTVRLYAIDDSYIYSVPSYNNPDEGEAWALIDDVWQYTNRPTPAEKNLPSIFIEEIEEIIEPEGLIPCATNQYRNPLTNRCKLLPEYESQQVPCKDGQYRSEETGRCRNIISDVVNLVPCAEGQERNPLTNRCRSISSVLGVSDLVPCKEGQERNPDTNRCRNIVSIPKADYAPEKTTETTDNSSMWLILAGVGAVVVGYGIWEWRKELSNIYKKIVSFLHIKK